MEQKNSWPSHKDYLNKTFLEELAHKLWNTKGTRFQTSERLLTRNNLSNKALGFLSAYLIIYSLFSVYQISGSAILDEKVIAFGSTTLSILLLVFSQHEANQDYKLRAQKFLECALKISELHDEIRLFQTLKTSTSDEKVKFCESLGKRYQKILSEYDNHDSIDYDKFRSRHKDYYQLSSYKVYRIRVLYYIRTKLTYHILIGLPVIVFVFSLVLSSYSQPLDENAISNQNTLQGSH